MADGNAGPEPREGAAAPSAAAAEEERAAGPQGQSAEGPARPAGEENGKGAEPHRPAGEENGKGAEPHPGDDEDEDEAEEEEGQSEAEPEAEADLPAVASGPRAQKGGGPPAKRSRAERRAAREAAAGRDCPIVVDATNHVAGRLASNVAKLLLGGSRVSIVNCERIMISGTRSNIVGEYRAFLEIASILHPKHGPFHPRRPDTIISRMIRGMLPREKPSGRAARRRLRAYVGAPRELGAYKRVRFEKAMIKRAPSGYTTMESLGDAVGWTR